MNWVTIIRLLLSIVNSIMDWVDDDKQQEIGRDQVIKKSLIDLAVKAKIAKKIDIGITNVSDDELADILHDYYRTDDSTTDKQGGGST